MITVKKIIERDTKNSNYSLFELSYGRCVRFAVCVCSGEYSAMEIVECDEEQAKELFCTFVNGDLSVEHLSDVVEDHKHAALLL